MVFFAAFSWHCAPDPQGRSEDAVADDLGRLHDTAPPRSRIVSLVPAATEILIALGASDRIVARTRYDEQPELASLPSVGGGTDPHIELLAELAPDLVILWPAAGAGVSLRDRLAAVGVDSYGAEMQTMADFRRHTGNLGRLVGMSERGERVVSVVEAQLAAARASWSGRDLVRVVYVVQEDPPMTVGPGTFLDSVLAASGAENVFRDIQGSWPLVSMEEVVGRDPSFVIVPVPGYGTPAVSSEYRDPSVDRLAELPGWRAVRAVASGRVISVDASLFGRPGPRMGVAARYLSSRFLAASRPADPSGGGCFPAGT